VHAFGDAVHTADLDGAVGDEVLGLALAAETQPL
jgi:hypothetical protein